MPGDLSQTIQAAFTDAAVATFAKMTMTTLTPCAGPEVNGPPFELTGTIGFLGGIAGNCALRMGAHAAQEAANRLAGETVDSAAEVADGVGELVNMIAGNAKAALQEFNISLLFPETIRGAGHEIGFRYHADICNLYFASDIGPIVVVVAYSKPVDFQEKSRIAP
ncbi:MAG: chemotaxis protein CheX [Chitinivibrionales bacterium]|nr:chemotaxis protein CheX [Chitinivibrionales bacterium]